MKILFITDIHQNIAALEKISTSGYDMIICGGDILDPANPDMNVAKRIIDILPSNTYYVPGNCDNNDELLALTAKFRSLHLRKISEKIGGTEYNLTGLGYARSLGDDFIEYRKFFTEDESRIWHFAKNSPAKFILPSCGVMIDNGNISYLPIEECLKKGESFIKKFGSFDENEAATFFDTIDSLPNGIMVCHSPVRGFMDQLPCLPPIGAVSAANAAKRLKPRLVLCGHFHEFSESITADGITYFNPGAVKDGKYGVINMEEKEIKCEIKKV